MRWDELFHDLDGQWESHEAAILAVEVADRTRAEAGQLRLVDRLRPARGSEIRLQLAGAGPLVGVLGEVGPDWLLVAEATGREALVPLAAVLSFTGAGRLSATPGSEGRVAARLGLCSALRRVAQDRRAVAVMLVDGGVVGGTIDRVGADFVELAEHPDGEPRRAATVRCMRAVALAAIAMVRSRGE